MFAPNICTWNVQTDMCLWFVSTTSEPLEQVTLTNTFSSWCLNKLLGWAKSQALRLVSWLAKPEACRSHHLTLSGALFQFAISTSVFARHIGKSAQEKADMINHRPQRCCLAIFLCSGIPATNKMKVGLICTQVSFSSLLWVGKQTSAQNATSFWRFGGKGQALVWENEQK